MLFSYSGSGVFLFFIRNRNVILKLHLDSCEHTHTLNFEKARIISTIYSESITTFKVVTIIITTVLFAALRIEPKVSGILGKCLTTKIHPSPNFTS